MQTLIGSELNTKINDESLAKLIVLEDLIAGIGKVVGVGSRRGRGRPAALPGTYPQVLT